MQTHLGRSGTVILSAAALLLSACADGASGHPPLTDLSEPGDDPADGGVPPIVVKVHGDAGTDADAAVVPPVNAVCNALAENAAHIDIVNIDTDPPMPVGGSVIPGVYALTAYEIYTGAGGKKGKTGSWFANVVSITSKTIDGAYFGPTSTFWYHSTADFTYPSATEGLWKSQCPKAGATTEFHYSATATTFVVFADNSTLLSFTKQ